MIGGVPHAASCKTLRFIVRLDYAGMAVYCFAGGAREGSCRNVKTSPLFSRTEAHSREGIIEWDGFSIVFYILDSDGLRPSRRGFGRSEHRLPTKRRHRDDRQLSRGRDHGLRDEFIDQVRYGRRGKIERTLMQFGRWFAFRKDLNFGTRRSGVYRGVG